MAPSSDGAIAPPATLLTADQLAALHAQAAAEAGPFVHPHRMRHIESWWHGDLCEWAAQVTGRATVTGLAPLSWREWVLLDLAHDVEPCPPPAPLLTARRTAERAAAVARETARVARHAAKRTEWAALAKELPVSVRVEHNYTSRRHHETHVQGVEHVLVDDDLTAGRLTRTAGQPLCWTPSRAKDLRAFYRLNDPLDDVPTCKACIRTAYRITGRPPASGLYPDHPE